MKRRFRHYLELVAAAHAWHISALAIRAVQSYRRRHRIAPDEPVRVIDGYMRVSPGEYERIKEAHPEWPQ